MVKSLEADGLAAMVTAYSTECACETCLQKDLCAKDGKCQKDLTSMSEKGKALDDACKGAAAEASAKETTGAIADLKKVVDKSCAEDSSAPAAMKRFAAAATAFAAAGLALIL